jgi:hypothetical protein
MSPQRFLRVLVVCSVLLITIATLPLGASTQSNSDVAHLCQKGAWRTLGPAGASVGFASQNDCRRYAADGGAVAPLAGIVIPAGATATMTGTLSSCNAITGSWRVANGAGGTFGSIGALSSTDCSNGDPNSLTFAQTAGPFPAGVVLTIVLRDVSCGATYTSISNHASVVSTASGYQVDITDSGYGIGRCSESGPRVPAPGQGNLSLAITFSD